MRGVLNSTEWQQDRVRHLQGMTRNGGTEGYLEAAVFTLKLNAVFILTLAKAIRQTHKQRQRTLNNLSTF